MKKLIVLFVGVMLALGLTGCSDYREALYKALPDEVLEKSPTWMVEDGKERQSEIYEIAEPLLTEYLSDKYGDEAVIKSCHYGIRLEGRPEDAGSGFLPMYEYYVPVYNGQVVAVCELNSREFSVFVNMDLDEPICYDNYQRGDIKEAIDIYIRSEIGSSPVQADITFADMVVVASSSFDDLDMTGMFHTKYDGDILAFLNDSGSDISIRYVYAGLDNIKFNDAAVVAFGQTDCEIVNFIDEASCAAYLNSGSVILAYMPYVRDIFSTVRNIDLVNYEHQDYSIPAFANDGDFRYTFPYCNVTREMDLTVDADYEKLDENLWRWVRTEKVSVLEEIDGVIHNKVVNYNVPVRIMSVYERPDDFVGYLYLDSISGYSEDKVYKLCSYDVNGGNDVSDVGCYRVEDLCVINNEYIYIDYSTNDDYWFIIEIINPIRDRESGTVTDKTAEALEALAGDDWSIDLSDPETAGKFFWEVIKYEFEHMFDEEN